jgi:hypothetical protein
MSDTPLPFFGNGANIGSDVADCIEQAKENIGLPPGRVTCRRCGVEAPIGLDACPSCHSFLSGTQAARTHGLYARRLPDDLRQSVESWIDDVISAQGGLDELAREPLRTGLIRSLKTAETGERLAIAAVIQAGGLGTPKGREIYTKALLPTIDRKLRLSLELGLSRRQKAIPTAAELLRGTPTQVVTSYNVTRKPVRDDD